MVVARSREEKYVVDCLFCHRGRSKYLLFDLAALQAAVRHSHSWHVFFLVLVVCLPSNAKEPQHSNAFLLPVGSSEVCQEKEGDIIRFFLMIFPVQTKE